MKTIATILLIDNHQLIREGIKQILESEKSFKVIAKGNSDVVITDLIEKYDPDIVLMDINFNGKEAIQNINSSFPKMKVIVLSFNEERKTVLEVIKLGVRGYLLKSMNSQSLIDAIQHVHAGGVYLDLNVLNYIMDDYLRLLEKRVTNLNAAYRKPLHVLSRRECQVLQLLANGNSNKSIAGLLGISQSTCKNHVNSILRKMNVNGRTHAVVVAIRNGWVKIDALNPSLTS